MKTEKKTLNSEVTYMLLAIPVVLIGIVCLLTIAFQNQIVSEIGNSSDEYYKYTLTEKMSLTHGIGRDVRTENYFRVIDGNGVEHLLAVPSHNDELYLTYKEGDEVTICFKTITPMFGEPYTLYQIDGYGVAFTS